MLLTGLAGRVGLALLVAPESDVYYYLKDAAEALPQEDTVFHIPLKTPVEPVKWIPARSGLASAASPISAPEP